MGRSESEGKVTSGYEGDENFENVMSDSTFKSMGFESDEDAYSN